MTKPKLPIQIVQHNEPLYTGALGVDSDHVGLFVSRESVKPLLIAIEEMYEDHPVYCAIIDSIIDVIRTEVLPTMPKQEPLEPEADASSVDFVPLHAEGEEDATPAVLDDTGVELSAEEMAVRVEEARRSIMEMVNNPKPPTTTKPSPVSQTQKSEKHTGLCVTYTSYSYNSGVPDEATVKRFCSTHNRHYFASTEVDGMCPLGAELKAARAIQQDEVNDEWVDDHTLREYYNLHGRDEWGAAMHGAFL